MNSVASILLQEEKSVYQFFRKMREHEVEKESTFRFHKVEPILQPIVSNNPNVITLFLSFHISVKRTLENGKVSYPNTYITHGHKITVPRQDFVLSAFEEKETETATKLGNILYNHWRGFNLFSLQASLQEEISSSYQLYFWYHEDKEEWILTNSMNQLTSFLGTEKGHIRHISLSPDASSHLQEAANKTRTLTDEEKSITLRFGTFMDAVLLQEQVETENKRHKQTAKIRELLAL